MTDKAGPTGATGSVMPTDYVKQGTVGPSALGANPKDAVGSAKAGTSYIPMPPLYEVGLAMMEGAIKYGPFNWRDSAVDNRIYVDAAKRHIDRYWNGQTRDPVTKTHELGLAIAGLMVLLDAEMCGKLIDSRPTAIPDGWIDAMEPRVALVKAFAEGERAKRLAKQKPQE